jgi:hypothetical protein
MPQPVQSSPSSLRLGRRAHVASRTLGRRPHQYVTVTSVRQEQDLLPSVLQLRMHSPQMLLHCRDERVVIAAFEQFAARAFEVTLPGSWHKMTITACAAIRATSFTAVHARSAWALGSTWCCLRRPLPRGLSGDERLTGVPSGRPDDVATVTRPATESSHRRVRGRRFVSPAPGISNQHGHRPHTEEMTNVPDRRTK